MLSLLASPSNPPAITGIVDVSLAREIKTWLRIYFEIMADLDKVCLVKITTKLEGQWEYQ